MSRARRKKAAERSRAKKLSTGIVLAVVGVAIIAVVGLIVLTNRTGTVPLTVSTPSFETGFTPEGLPYKGAANAPVTIEDYSDYQCTHCRDFVLQTEPLIDQAYIATGKVKLVKHYFGFQPETRKLAAAAMCAAEQAKFWEFDYALFADQRAANSNSMLMFARRVGLDIDAFSKCQNSDVNSKVQTFTNQAQAVGVNSTPTFFINGKEVLGALSFDSFKAEIEQALAGVK